MNPISNELVVRSKELLRQIGKLGEVLIGVKVELEREGTGLETRYRVKRVE